MKAQQILNTLPKEAIKAEILKSKNLFIKLILKPLLDKIILIIISAILGKFDVTPKYWKIMDDIDPDPGTTPDPPQ